MELTQIKNNANIKLIQNAAIKTGAKVFIVGGALRDIIMQNEISDYDFIVFGDVNQFTDTVSEMLSRPGISIGGVDKNVTRIVKNGIIHDFTNAKADTLEEDIPLRDFTMNALAYSLADEKMIDLCGALDDINAKNIKMVSDSAFDDDPLRMLRAFRFMAQLGFRIDEHTQNSITKKVASIHNSAEERIRAELFMILASDRSYDSIKAMADCGILYELFPELKESVGCKQNDYHHLDVMDHTLLAYKNLEDIFCNLPKYFEKTHSQLGEFLAADNSKTLLKYAILLHDIAKPVTRSVGIDGRIHFYGHCEMGEKMLAPINRRLRLSCKDDDISRAIVRQHLRLINFFGKMDEGAVSKKSIIRYFLRLRDIGLHVIIHNLADLMAARGIKRAEESELAKVIAFSDMMLDIYFNDYLKKAANPPLLTGYHLIEHLSMPPSPAFKRILDKAYEMQMQGEITTLEEALKYAKRASA